MISTQYSRHLLCSVEWVEIFALFLKHDDFQSKCVEFSWYWTNYIFSVLWSVVHTWVQSRCASAESNVCLRPAGYIGLLWGLLPSGEYHYSDVIMGAMASQITSLTIVHSTVCSCADQRKHQSSASLAFVRGIHRWPVNSPRKWPVTRKMFPFDDVIMVCSKALWSYFLILLVFLVMTYLTLQVYGLWGIFRVAESLSRLVIFCYAFPGECCDWFNCLCRSLSQGSRLCRISIHFGWLLYQTIYHPHVSLHQDDSGPALAHFGLFTEVLLWLCGPRVYLSLQVFGTQHRKCNWYSCHRVEVEVILTMNDLYHKYELDLSLILPQ